MKPLRIVKNFGGGGNPSLGLDLTRFWGVEESEKKNKPSFFSAFTLAEMMVVMLILSIVLAAMAPVMTTRNKPNNSSPWQYQANNRSNAWFGAGSAQHAMIGQNSYGADDTVAKLLITVGAGDGSTSLLAFKRGNTQLGRLYMNDDGGMMFGSTNNILGTNANAVGRQVSAYGTSSVAFGSVASALGNTSTAVGSNVTAGNTGSIAIGTSTTANADNAIGIGNTSTVSAARSIALGNEAIASAENAVAVGKSAAASNVGSIAVGQYASASGNSSVAIGAGSDDLPTAARFVNDVVIGYGSSTKRTNDTATTGESLAIGGEATAYDATSIAIGSRTTSKSKSIAIGGQANSFQVNSIAIGSEATVHENSSIETLKSGSIAIGKASEATPGLVVGSPGQGRFLHLENSSIALGSYAVAKNGGIAIGSPNSVMLSSSPDKWEPEIGSGFSNTEANNSGIAIGVNTKANNGIAIGDNARAINTGNIAIGAYACSGVSGSHKICIGANSGPVTDTNANEEPEGKWKTDDVERIFIGSRSAQNGGTAVLEVHNGEKKVGFWTDQEVSSSVVINGNLLVKGQVLFPDAPHGPSNGGDNKSFRYFDGGHDDCDGAECEFRWHKDYSRGGVIGFYGRFGGTKRSDRRLKYVGKENTSGLDKIRQLKVFNYTFKKDTTKTPHVGVIAQDLQKVFPNAVKKGADGFLTIRMEDMFYAVINAIKELDAKYQAQEKRINELEKRIEKLEAKAK